MALLFLYISKSALGAIPPPTIINSTIADLIHKKKKDYIKRMDNTKKWAIVFWLIIFHLIYYFSLAKNQLHLTMKDLSLIFSP